MIMMKKYDEKSQRQIIMRENNHYGLHNIT